MKVKPKPERPDEGISGRVAAKSTPERPKDENSKFLYGKSTHPWALILFSGKARPGDIHQNLVSRGWTVCSVDILSPKPTDILDDSIWDEINKDILFGNFKALWVATPCGTFSPLMEKPQAREYFARWNASEVSRKAS